MLRLQHDPVSFSVRSFHSLANREDEKKRVNKILHNRFRVLNEFFLHEEIRLAVKIENSHFEL